MRAELQDKLFAKYPRLFVDRNASMQETCMCWGIDTGNGWYNLLEELCQKLEPLIERTYNQAKEGDCRACGCPRSAHYGCRSNRPGKCLRIRRHADATDDQPIEDQLWACWCDGFQVEYPRAEQVKEKFGGLRFYMTSKTEEMRQHIRAAENASYKTCELCGEPGKPSGIGWIRTLCAKCEST